MPHLVQMDKRYGKKGLQLIGAHVQGGTNDQVQAKVDDLKMKFPVTKGVRGPSVGGNGIPKILVFNTTGKLVFAGHPMDGVDKVIKKELRSAKVDESSSTSNRGFGLPERPKDLSEMRAWTNAEGKTIQAALISVNGDKAKLRLKNGKQVDYPIAKLSEGDQTFIESKKPKT